MTDRTQPRKGATLQFPATEIGEVCGSLPFAGKAKTIQEMDAAVADEARRSAAEDGAEGGFGEDA